MSHAATHWLATVPPNDMTHGEFRVLFHLCDCHNASMGCFPKQTYLRDHTGLSNGGLNKALGELERKGLIRRKQERDERTNRQKPTRYVLGFELSDVPEPTPLSGAGSVSTFGAVPSPLLEGSVSTGVESYIEEPVREPVKEPCASEADPQTIGISPTFLEEFLEVHPRPGDPVETEAALKKAIAAGTDPAAILSGAKAYALEQKGNELRFVSYSQNWLTRQGWVQFLAKSATKNTANAEAVKKRWARWIRTKAENARHCSAAMARQLCAEGLVTAQECRAVGIDV
ncbi:helix-turn-helix domain-containing protein [uncultured Sulfitobacter sp.]|uniref:helix-turn-helix domain-containing protein n=1 Tax=uncultured Sulfitobacter sp. TaxID=191468 RepID=UPI0030FC4939